MKTNNSFGSGVDIQNHNDGTDKVSIGEGKKIFVPFGKDASEYAGSANEERIKDGFKGSDTNLEHTITGGGKSNQSQDGGNTKY